MADSNPKEAAQLLVDFRTAIRRWFDGEYEPEGKDDLRQYINRNLKRAEQLVAAAGCLKLVTVGPPPAIGGLVVQNANPFHMLFENLWGMSLIPSIADMCEQAIGVYDEQAIRMTGEEVLRELRELYAQREGMDQDAGRRWVGRITALVSLVDRERADVIRTHTPIFSMPVSEQMRGAAWEGVLQQVEEVIAMLEVKGYDSPQHTNPGRDGPRRVFIGHGHSSEWLKLKDFLTDRLSLPYEEFNREPAAGYSTKERLDQMLESTSFAFLVLTGEDVDTEGQLHARENVIHEVGLFQGRHGFPRAIVLLEEGCKEFSNIHGLIQIRFPRGNILAAAEEIRRVLEREGLLRSVP